MMHYKKIYFLFEYNKKFAERFEREKEDCCLITTSKLKNNLPGNTKKIITIESLFDESFFEMNYQDDAAKLYDHFLLRTNADKKASLKINNVSIIDSNAGIMILYYLQKTCVYMDKASFLLNRYSTDQVIFDVLNNDFLYALYFECRKRKIKISPEKLVKKKVRPLIYKFIWFGSEFVKSIFNHNHYKAKDNYDIMFICNGVKFHETIAPIVRNIIENESKKIIILTKCDLGISIQIKHPNVQYLHVQSFRNLKYLIKLLYRSFKITKAWYRLTSYKLFEVRKAYDDEYLIYSMKKWFKKYALKSIRILLLSEIIFDKYKPQIIVVTDPTDYEVKCLTLSGKTFNIPSFCIQYGLAGDFDSEWRYFKQDYVGVFGKTSAETLKNHGVMSERIILSGNPRFDSYRENYELRNAVRSKLNIENKTTVITFMSVPPTSEEIGQMEGGLTIDEYETIIKSIYEIPKSIPEVVLIVKPHPEELKYTSLHKAYSDKAKIYGDRVRFCDSFNAYEIINISDMIITAQSTTGLEAVYLNKPLVYINMTSRHDLCNYASSGVAYPVRDKDYLSDAISLLLNDVTVKNHYQKKREEYLSDNLSHRGKSAVNCTDIILKIAQTRRMHAI